MSRNNATYHIVVRTIIAYIFVAGPKQSILYNSSMVFNVDVGRCKDYVPICYYKNYEYIDIYIHY